MTTTLATSQKWGDTPGWEHKFLRWYFFLQEFRKGEGLNSWDWRSLCSHQVPMKFSMCSYQVPYAFPTCSQCVCNLFPNFLVCVPQDILDSITLYPITFAQSWILITNVGGQKDNTLIIPFKEPKVLFGEVSQSFRICFLWWANQSGLMQNKNKIEIWDAPLTN